MKRTSVVVQCPAAWSCSPAACPVAVVSRGHSSADTASLGIACGSLIPRYSNLWLERSHNASGAQHLQPNKLLSKYNGSQPSSPSTMQQTGQAVVPQRCGKGDVWSRGAQGSLRKPSNLQPFTHWTRGPQPGTPVTLGGLL